LKDPPAALDHEVHGAIGAEGALGFAFSGSGFRAVDVHGGTIHPKFRSAFSSIFSFGKKVQSSCNNGLSHA
ncbi:hypothetical protein ABTQ07_22355, partial [Acinetobacter baumannii]